MPHDVDAADGGEHPDTAQLERFMRNEAAPAERRWIVRHLIAGCPRCLAVTSELWALGDPPAAARRRAARAAAARRGGVGERRGGAAAEAYTGIFERLAEVGERIETERAQAPRLVAELLAMPPAARAALLAGGSGAAAGGHRRFATPPVCQQLLERSREAAAGDPRLAGQLADLALAIGERLDEDACGVAVARGLRARAWAHLGHARRLGGDLDGAEWALALAEALAAGVAAGTGDRGETGGTGDRGEAGNAGAGSVAGDTSASGVADDPGDHGVAGDPGDRGMAMAGDTGALGEAGDTGRNGEAGDIGRRGNAGEIGRHGEAGDTGRRGEAGDTDDRGASGEPGWLGEIDEADAHGEAAIVPRKGATQSRESAAGFEPAEWAELLVFRAGLRADRGELGAADRLLGRAARLFRSAGEDHRAGGALVEQGSIRAELGDRGRAAELLRAGIDLLDLAAAPRQVAAALCRLAALLGGVWPGTPVASAGGPASLAAGQAGPAAPQAVPAAAPQGAHAAIPARPLPGMPSRHRGAEALQLLGRARALYKGLGDAAAEARLSRLQGQLETAAGRLDEAEATLRTAAAALARHGLGREACAALVELALLLVRQGRGREARALGRERHALLQARDKSWRWYSGVLMFHVEADRHFAEVAEVAAAAAAPEGAAAREGAEIAEGAQGAAAADAAAAAAAADGAVDAAVDGGLVSELSRYLAAPLDPVDGQGRGRRPAPRLSRVA